MKYFFYAFIICFHIYKQFIYATDDFCENGCNFCYNDCMLKENNNKFICKTNCENDVCLENWFFKN